jgi:peptidyl-prolyl cis-trans isomerase-like protein 2
MVKRQKEKQYLSATEQKAQGRSRSNTGVNNNNAATVGIVQKSLPFKCCALTLTPFINPVCTIVEQEQQEQGQEQGNNNNNKYGIIFDNAALMEYVIKNKKDPVTGKKSTIASSKPGRIITLNIDKDTDTGEWQCPVMTKVFSDYNTKIVAIVTPSKKEANVYSYEAYNELNVKPKNYLDLITGDKFSPKNDVIILNDPTNQHFQRCVRDVSTFWHIKNARTKNKLQTGSGADNSNGNVRKSVTATRVMEQLYKDKKQREENERIKIKEDAKAAEQKRLDDLKNNDPNNHYTFDRVPNNERITFPIPVVDVTGVKFTTGFASGGFTSTADNTVVAGGSKDGRHAYASKEAILQSQFNLMTSKSWKGRKGYVRLFIEIRNSTNNDNMSMSMSKSSRKQKNNNVVITVPLLLELHCDIVPRTCTNFLGLCRRKRYDGTIFHRLISNFMIQGGGEKMKQTKTKNNQSSDDSDFNSMNNNSSASRKYNADAPLWGPEPFEDEFDQRLKHDGEGILAMANSGPNTNKQQFYITFNSCAHLDRKHTVFGNIVEGMKEFNSALSKVKTDSKDRPYITNINSDGDDERMKTTVNNNAVVVIVATEVLDDPAMDAQKKEEHPWIEVHVSSEAIKYRKRKLVSAIDNDNNNSASATTKTTKKTTKIGKYLSGNAIQKNNTMEEDEGNVVISNSKSTTAATTTATTGVGTSNSTIPGSTSLGLPAYGATTGSAATATAKTKAKTEFGNFSSW